MHFLYIFLFISNLLFLFSHTFLSGERTMMRKLSGQASYPGWTRKHKKLHYQARNGSEFPSRVEETVFVW